MLFAKAMTDGIRVSGFLDHPALVLVTAKAATGERLVVPFDCQMGPVSEFRTLKGMQIEDVVGIPVLKTRRTLYVNRPVRNADEIISWFKAQGMNVMLAPEDMHITIAYSKKAVDWEGTGDPDKEEMEIQPDLKRSVTPLGDAGAVVMRVRSPELEARWKSFISKGATWDHDGYRPHVTLTYAPVDAGRFVPFPGTIKLGRERWSELDLDWSPTLKAGDRKSPPEGYPTDRSEYAVPEEYEFPIDEKHIHAAIGYFHTHKFKDEAQKRSAARRILRAAKRHGVHVSDDSDVSRAAHGE